MNNASASGTSAPRLRNTCCWFLCKVLEKLDLPGQVVFVAEIIAGSDEALLGHMMLAAGRIARTLHLDESGFRLVINNGPDAGEAVPHLHMHLLAGRKLEWPPG